MVVRNSWVTQGKEAAGFTDKAEFEKPKEQVILLLKGGLIHNYMARQLPSYLLDMKH